MGQMVTILSQIHVGISNNQLESWEIYLSGLRYHLLLHLVCHPCGGPITPFQQGTIYHTRSSPLTGTSRISEDYGSSEFGSVHWALVQVDLVRNVASSMLAHIHVEIRIPKICGKQSLALFGKIGKLGPRGRHIRFGRDGVRVPRLQRWRPSVWIQI
ncbi:hypothetical protein BGX38DRAFT_1190335 [Terfezia claveryi]|nr:hypothetical protein BGX38DRAFT_1190335 [Terfezia claveryi]